MFPRKSWARKAAHAFICLLIFVCVSVLPAIADNTLVSSWKFASDSDGATADNGVTVTLSFNLSGVAFSAVGPGQNISGQGSYSTSGGSITINLPGIGKSANNQPFSINVNTLTLPFKVFSEGPGSSTWFRVMTPGGNNSNPPEPPNPPNPPNNPNNPNQPGNSDDCPPKTAETCNRQEQSQKSACKTWSRRLQVRSLCRRLGWQRLELGDALPPIT